MKLEKMHDNAQLFKQILSLKTDILAIKMIKKESDIPEGAIRRQDGKKKRKDTKLETLRKEHA